MTESLPHWYLLGAGNMGSGIAQKSAQEEFDVQMVDREQQWVERGEQTIADFLAEAVERFFCAKFFVRRR